MNNINIKNIQNAFLERQQLLQVTSLSDCNSENKVTFNGKLEIIDLKIDTSLLTNELKGEIILLINKGIRETSIKVNAIMVDLQKEFQF